MFLHQLRQHFVLAVQLRLQKRNPLLLRRGLGPTVRMLERRRPVLKEDLLPLVELRRLNAGRTGIPSSLNG